MLFQFFSFSMGFYLFFFCSKNCILPYMNWLLLCSVLNCNCFIFIHHTLDTLDDRYFNMYAFNFFFFKVKILFFFFISSLHSYKNSHSLNLCVFFCSHSIIYCQPNACSLKSDKQCSFFIRFRMHYYWYYFFLFLLSGIMSFMSRDKKL